MERQESPDSRPAHLRVTDTALLSEAALSDWLRPEEEEAWAYLQPDHLVECDQAPEQAGKNMEREIAPRITADPGKCGGRPCVRGMRIRVTDVIDLMAHGLSVSEVLEELPDLEREDVLACLKFASSRSGHPVLVG